MKTTNKSPTYEQRRWEQDCGAHGHYLRRLVAAQSDYCKKYCEERLAEIEARWPQHFKSRSPS